MSHPLDTDFINSMGGRKVKGKKEFDSGNETSDVVHDVLEAEKEAMKVKAAQKILGLEPKEPKGEGGEKKDDIQTSIVTKAMDTQEKAISRFQDETEKMRQDVIGAQNAAHQNLMALFDEKLKRLDDKQNHMDKLAEKAKEAGAPKSDFDAYNSVKVELEKLKGEQPKASETPKIGYSDDTAIKLEQMRHQHELMMQKLIAENDRARQEFSLKMLEFQDEAKLRWTEYTDSKDFKDKGLKGVSDIVASIAAGVRGEASSGEEVLGARVASFHCQGCGSKISVPAGSGTVTCPNKDCGMEYEIKEKG